MTHTSKAAKMASEMLAADRRARKRARRARTVHKSPLIRPETFEPAAQRQSVGPVSRHTCSAAGAIDLLLAVILWGYAFACVAITIALFTKELISK